MAFWNLGNLELAEFRPGIMSKAEIGDNLIMVCMEIGPGKEDATHIPLTNAVLSWRVK